MDKTPRLHAMQSRPTTARNCEKPAHRYVRSLDRGKYFLVWLMKWFVCMWGAVPMSTDRLTSLTETWVWLALLTVTGPEMRRSLSDMLAPEARGTVTETECCVTRRKGCVKGARCVNTINTLTNQRRRFVIANQHWLSATAIGLYHWGTILWSDGKWNFCVWPCGTVSRLSFPIWNVPKLQSRPKFVLMLVVGLCRIALQEQSVRDSVSFGVDGPRMFSFQVSFPFPLFIVGSWASHEPSCALPFHSPEWSMSNFPCNSPEILHSQYEELSFS